MSLPTFYVPSHKTVYALIAVLKQLSEHAQMYQKAVQPKSHREQENADYWADDTPLD
jgi:hypothetical protein